MPVALSRRSSAFLSVALILAHSPKSRAMAWRSHGTDNTSLVAALRANHILKHPACVDAMRKVDRGNYVPREFAGTEAYEDHPLPIGYNATISAPHMHAACLEWCRERVRDESERRERDGFDRDDFERTNERTNERTRAMRNVGRCIRR